MGAKKDLTPTEKLSEAVVRGMQEKKASDIVILDLRKVKNSVADFFVICSGSSDTQLDAIADAVDDEVYKDTQENPWHQEGRTNKEWLLIDYVDVVAHIFKKEKRDFYSIEELWGDAKIISVKA